MKLTSRIKIGHGRCVGPDETIARLDELLLHRFSYWLHEESLSNSLHWSAMFIDEHPEFRAMGKGTTRAFSHAGALAEGAEWLTACEVDHLPGYLAAHESEVDDALPISDLLAHIATATPPVLDRIRNLDDAQHWVDGHSFVQNKTLKVPIEYVRHIGGPNGKATGNFLEEAIVHATHEIFERRAQITVLRNKMVVPTIDSESITDPAIHEQIAFVRSKGIEVILKDLSFGGVLPCVGAYFVDPHIPNTSQFHHFFKVGASFDKSEALLRNFTEFFQGRRSGDFIIPESPPEALKKLLEPDFRRLQTCGPDCDNFLSAFMFGMTPYQNADFLREGEVIPFDPGPCYADCLDDISHARQICGALGKDYIAVDLTDPDIGFPVAQVIIPGYSDVLPFHPADSRGLFQRWTRDDVLHAYGTGEI